MIYYYIVFIVLVVLLIYLFKKSFKKITPVLTAELEEGFEYLKTYQLGNEMVGFDALLYDGMMNESYIDSYVRRIGGKEVDIVFKQARSLDKVSLFFNEEDVSRIREKIKRQNENALHFHISNGFLVLVFGEEINNGRWYCNIVAAWELI